MTSPLLDSNELTLIRYWLNGIPMDTLADFCGDDKPADVIAELRARLLLKSRRLQTDWGVDWLERKSSGDWVALALNRVGQLQLAEDIPAELSQPLAYWLADGLLEKLAPAKLALVSEWQALYHAHGSHGWWQEIPGLGAVTAKAIEQQLVRHFPDVLTKPAPPLVVLQTDVVPLDQFLLPDPLNGEDGSNRSPNQPFIPASDDYQAISCWLARLEPGSHTLRSYQREAERLLLWAVLAQQKALSSLNMVDMAAFRAFLADPQPAALWIGPPQKRGQANWKPFTGPLSQRSRRFSETVLNGLFNFLVAQRYLMHNPLQALAKLKAPNGHSHIGTHRSFTEDQWWQISAFLDCQAGEGCGEVRQKWLRTRLIVQLAYGTGMRLHELAQATLGDLEVRQRKGKTQYWLSVLGKGHKIREVPLPLSLYLLLAETYPLLTGRQINRPTDGHPLIPPLRGPDSKPLTPLALHKVIKEAFSLAAKDLQDEHPETAEKLQAASAHWLRHTHGSLAVDRNIPLPMIRDNLGHSNIATTSHYVHADDDARHDAFAGSF